MGSTEEFFVNTVNWRMNTLRTWLSQPVRQHLEHGHVMFLAGLCGDVKVLWDYLFQHLPPNHILALCIRSGDLFPPVSFIPEEILCETFPVLISSSRTRFLPVYEYTCESLLDLTWLSYRDDEADIGIPPEIRFKDCCPNLEGITILCDEKHSCIFDLRGLKNLKYVCFKSEEHQTTACYQILLDDNFDGKVASYNDSYGQKSEKSFVEAVLPTWNGTVSNDIGVEASFIEEKECSALFKYVHEV
jgi:hypothetical protein